MPRVEEVSEVADRSMPSATCIWLTGLAPRQMGVLPATSQPPSVLAAGVGCPCGPQRASNSGFKPAPHSCWVGRVEVDRWSSAHLSTRGALAVLHRASFGTQAYDSWQAFKALSVAALVQGRPRPGAVQEPLPNLLPRNALFGAVRSGFHPPPHTLSRLVRTSCLQGAASPPLGLLDWQRARGIEDPHMNF